MASKPKSQPNATDSVALDSPSVQAPAPTHKCVNGHGCVGDGPDGHGCSVNHAGTHYTHPDLPGERPLFADA